MSTFDLIRSDIESYCEAHSTPENELLYRLNRHTNLETLNPRMLSGQLQGVFLSFIAKMLSPKTILEIGTFTGYSALCLAEGLSEYGYLHTIEANEEYEERIKNYFSQSPLKNKIVLHIGKAEEIVPTLNETWDLVFIDADKENYQIFYDIVFPKVRKGGFILIDNTLWNGKVVREVAPNDKDTKSVMAFNDFVQNDNRVRNLLLPFRDGIMIVEKL